MTFLRNAWYVTCASGQLADKPLSRKIYNQKGVNFRRADGAPAVLEDYCPYRGLPLSLGFVDDGHLLFVRHRPALGRCGVVQSMQKQRVNLFPSIRPCPVIEKSGFFWISPADAATPDDAGFRCGWPHSRLLLERMSNLEHESSLQRRSQS